MKNAPAGKFPLRRLMLEKNPALAGLFSGNDCIFPALPQRRSPRPGHNRKPRSRAASWPSILRPRPRRATPRRPNHRRISRWGSSSMKHRPLFDLAAFTAVPDLARFSQTAFPGMRWSGHLEISESGQHVFAGELSVGAEPRPILLRPFGDAGRCTHLLQIAEANGGAPLSCSRLTGAGARLRRSRWMRGVIRWKSGSPASRIRTGGSARPKSLATLSWRSPRDSVLRPVPASVFVHNP